MSVKQNLDKVYEQIRLACQKCNRNIEEIKIIAVTKYVDINKTIEVLEVGIANIGESKTQDAKSKLEQIQDKAIWHFIGHLQTNKVKDVVGQFQYIHSLDRLSLAKEINKKAEQLNITVPCFVQINISGEESKHGLEPSQAKEFIAGLAAYPAIQVIGLMTMAPYGAVQEETRPIFRQLKELQLELQKNNWSHAPLTELSMGMSNDFTVAVEEGATYIRLGTILLGSSSNK